MSILEQLLAIARNTLLESIRQPIVLIVCLASTLLGAPRLSETGSAGRQVTIGYV